jgi:GNAT superfamily N-acetyltransferase
MFVRMSLQIRPVASARELRRFVDVPWRLFDPARHPQWAPPLRLSVRDALDPRHPFWATAERALFLAERGGRPVGRVAAIDNAAHTARAGAGTGFFGFFECADDPEAAAALLAAARGWLAPRGAARLEGPVSPSTNYECGVLVDGFEHHQVLMTTWNPPYYDALLRGAGLAPAKDLLGWWFARDTAGGEFRLPGGYAGHAARARERARVEFRDLEPRRMAREVALCWEVYNAAWEPNWGFVPMSRAEFGHLGKDLARIADPRFCFAAEIDGAPAGFALALPDYNLLMKRIPSGRLLPTGIFTLLAGRRSLRTLRVLALGVKQEHRTRGIFALFIHELVRRCLEAGITGAEASWVLEDNHRMNRPIAAMGATPYRRWRLYEGAVA